MRALEDKDIAIKLDKFQTKATPITDDELYAISYDQDRPCEEDMPTVSMMRSFTTAHALCANKIRKLLRCLRLPARKIRLQNRLRLTVNDLGK